MNIFKSLNFYIFSKKSIFIAHSPFPSLSSCCCAPSSTIPDLLGRSRYQSLTLHLYFYSQIFLHLTFLLVVPSPQSSSIPTRTTPHLSCINHPDRLCFFSTFSVDLKRHAFPLLFFLAIILFIN